MHKAEQKKRRFFGLGGSSRDISKDKIEKVGRSTSVRRKDPPQQPESHNTDARSRTDYERWSPSDSLADADETERYAVSEQILLNLLGAEDLISRPNSLSLTHKSGPYQRVWADLG